MSTSSLTTLTEYSDSQFPTTLIFSQDNPYNCTITLDEKPIYEVRTRREIVKKLGHNDLLVTTDVFSPNGELNGELIASVVWHGVNSDLITWPRRGLRNAKLGRWLKKSMIPFSKYTIWLLFLLEDKSVIIAYFERAMPYVNLQPGYNYNPFPKPSQLHLSERGDEMMEEVVLSFLIVEKDRRRSDGSIENWAEGQTLMASSSANILHLAPW
ncbi:hypothetical protein A7U60_g5480 [Sanghuangporus baumii]|uniref:DUF6593 domain-containing protein n=1 Tax=Sanghuangporus baumii TaxID=108892 RepID=A0A9Q5HWJ6_SANBA|nr:hypothetical protein A7U60_g5480 [Sanghuangporus baumii]